MCEPDRWEDPLDGPIGGLPERLARAVALIRERAPAQVRVAELSAAAGLSKYHLSRLFSRHFGEPPHRFQQTRRLALAAHLLRTGNRPVHVAEALHFTDQAHLAHRFKRAFGVTPAKFSKGVLAESRPCNGDSGVLSA
jgi:AraC-like DNA-binding protein